MSECCLLWAALLTRRKLFPLLATMRFDKSAAYFRFEVTSVRPEKLTRDDTNLFQPPSGWFEVRPAPF